MVGEVGIWILYYIRIGRGGREVLRITGIANLTTICDREIRVPGQAHHVSVRGILPPPLLGVL